MGDLRRLVTLLFHSWPWPISLSPAKNVTGMRQGLMLVVVFGKMSSVDGGSID